MAISIGDAVVHLLGDDSRLKKTLDQTMKRMGQVGKKMAAVGSVITGGFLLAGKQAADFVDLMKNVATLGVTNLDELQKGAKQTAMTFGVDLKDAATETYNIISAGIPQDAAIMVLEGAAKGATAGVGTLANAVDVGTSILNAFDLKGKSAVETSANFEMVMGQAASAVKFGKTTFEDMGDSLGRVASLMNTAGLGSDELFASIAALLRMTA